MDQRAWRAVEGGGALKKTPGKKRSAKLQQGAVVRKNRKKSKGSSTMNPRVGRLKWAWTEREREPSAF